MRERNDITFGKDTTPADVWAAWRADLGRDVVETLAGKLRPGFRISEDAIPGG